MVEEQEQSPQHKLLIELILKPWTTGWYRQIIHFIPPFRQSCPVQNKPFLYGFRVTNIDTKPFPSGSISNIESLSLEGSSNVGYTERDLVLAIRALQPTEHVEIWVPDEAVTPFSGTFSTSCNVQASDSNPVLLFRYDSSNKHKLPLEVNRWYMVIHIQGQLETEQARTNTLILWLTFFTLWEAILGIKNTLVAVAQVVVWMLSSSATFLRNIIQ